MSQNCRNQCLITFLLDNGRIQIREAQNLPDPQRWQKGTMHVEVYGTGYCIKFLHLHHRRIYIITTGFSKKNKNLQYLDRVLQDTLMNTNMFFVRS
jgi:hypothetical protein